MVLILEDDTINIQILRGYIELVRLENYVICRSLDELNYAVANRVIDPLTVSTVFCDLQLAHGTTGEQCVARLIELGFRGNLLTMHSNNSDGLHRETFGPYAKYLARLIIIDRMKHNLLYGGFMFASDMETRIARNQWRLH